ncbi:hypothetical protein DEJ45_04895 [Streptomyces venezuelae]|uniref:hypothetical protein n=1 Tax=Streptomyces venezuelae TaxID=54571 RepID=UPI00123CCA6B|nr:hypothetical protein [Streptomyces venezuelae]QES11799.1 hypothetical protein DEJ45_04895 [Streptomyces venezuelae]
MRNTDAQLVLRYALGGLGLGLIGLGGWLVAAEPDPAGVLLWLTGAVVLHDGVLAPLVLAVGLLIAARPARGLWRGALIVAGSVTLVTLPLLVRPGEPPNPSALPLPYGRNLAIVLGVVGVVTGVLYLVRRRGDSVRRRGELVQRRGQPVRSRGESVRRRRERRERRESPARGPEGGRDRGQGRGRERGGTGD